ncbi:hypothetical protein [Pyxidicoccus caerfyrddinensis]|nr:hypothetical protein [Pyxidicoccus caerfyrddinensis]
MGVQAQAAEGTVLYETVKDNLATLLAEAKASSRSTPVRLA